MDLRKCIFTNNACYKAGTRMKPKGVMVHSTGANNPTLKRYVQPNDGDIGENLYGNHWNMYRPGGRLVCVHAFIGKLENGNIATYQTLPFDYVGYHSGSGVNGSANTLGYIGFEICEDDLTNKEYFDEVYKEATEFTAHLCKMYNLNPLKDVICHSEGAKLGIASNHADVMHWFSRFNKTMDDFRDDVNTLVNGEKEPEKVPEDNDKLYRVQIGAYRNKDNAVKMERELAKDGFHAFINFDGDLYRVQVGAFKVKQNALNLQKQLEKLGYNTYVNC